MRIATTYRTPVMLLSDGYLANGSEPWRLPDVADLPDLRVANADAPNAETADGTAVFRPYLRDPETLARPWAPPGTPGLEHRIGGIEKADVTGDISYDPDNHDLMVRLRQAKVDGIAATIGDAGGRRPDRRRRACSCSGWGSTYGPIAAAARLVRGAGGRVARAHLRHLNPFPANTGEVLRPLPPGAGAGDEPRPARPAAAGQVPRRCRGLQPGARPAVHGDRAGRGDHQQLEQLPPTREEAR